jgi:hypothetical protein
MTRILLIARDRPLFLTEEELPADQLADEINSGRMQLNLSRLGFPEGQGHLTAICFEDLVVLSWEANPGSEPLPKNTDCLNLSNQEKVILQGLIEGRKVKDISVISGVKMRTVREQIKVLKTKFHALTTEQLVARAVTLGLASPGEGLQGSKNHTE